MPVRRFLFAGPDLTVAWRSRRSAEFGVEAPLWQDDEASSSRPMRGCTSA